MYQFSKFDEIEVTFFLSPDVGTTDSPMEAGWPIKDMWDYESADTCKKDRVKAKQDEAAGS